MSKEIVPFTPSGYKVKPRIAPDEKGRNCFAFFMSPSHLCTVEEAEANARLFERSPAMYKVLEKAQSFIHSMRCAKEGIADDKMNPHEVIDVIKLDEEIINELKRIIEDK